MPGTHPINGSLAKWEDLEMEEDWAALLLGNGLSINVSDAFEYASLYEQAVKGSTHSRLLRDDLALFQAFDTENFEVVLGNLNIAIRTAQALGRNPRDLLARYKCVQKALGGAVRTVHINRPDMPDAALEKIKAVMEAHRVIFATSYDLLVYWAMGFGGDFGSLVDLFTTRRGDRCEFQPDEAEIPNGVIPVYYLHGALHLVVTGGGTTAKLVRTRDETILDRFGQPDPDDPQARPLLVSEGSSAEKLRVIESNPYLAFAFKQLEKCDLPLVVFGSALADQDMHLVEAINLHRKRPVAVSMTRDSKANQRQKQAEIRARLTTSRLYFYDAGTHPLGRRINDE